jgi:hypothetical protein
MRNIRPIRLSRFSDVSDVSELPFLPLRNLSSVIYNPPLPLDSPPTLCPQLSMSTLLFILFLFIGPGIWIYGLISIFRESDKKGSSASSPLLTKLHQLLATNPQISLQEALAQIKTTPPPPPPSYIVRTQPQPATKPTQSPQFDLAHWYSDNSINLLLYLGAFLIITAALVFVGFQWDQFSGPLKAGVFSLFTLVFLFMGLWFVTIDKIKSAGLTFTAIGALLVPVAGMAWYTFVFKDIGISQYPVLLVTSLVCLLLYTFLSQSGHGLLYAYLSPLSVYALILSAANLTTTLPAANFSLITITSLGLTLIAKYSRLPLPPKTLTHITHGVTALSVIILIPTLGATGQLTHPAALIGLATLIVFYVVNFVLEDQIGFLYLALALGPFTLFQLTQYLNMNTTHTALTLLLNMCVYLAVSIIFHHYRYLKEAEANVFAALVIGLIVFVFTTATALPASIGVLTTCLLALGSLIGYTINPQAAYLYFSGFFLSLAIRLSFLHVFLLSPNSILLVATYTLIAITLLFTHLTLHPKPYAPALLHLSVYFGFISLVPALGMYPQITLLLFLYSALATYYAFRRTDVVASFVANPLFVLTIYTLWVYLKLDRDALPLLFSATALGFYTLHKRVPSTLSPAYLASGLSLALITPVLTAPLYPFTRQMAFPILSSFLSSFLFAYHWTKDRQSGFLYFSGAIFTLTLIWATRALGLTDTLYTTIPLSLYFMGVSLHRFYLKDSTSDALAVIGALILYLPSFILSFDTNPAKHTLALILAGITFISSGISLQAKIFRDLGIIGIIIAVVPYTYTYILGLPRWLVIAIIGALFIAVALYLLLRRPTPAK